jgi:hypothetical protein
MNIILQIIINKSNPIKAFMFYHKLVSESDNNLLRLVSSCVGLEPLNFASPAGVIDALHDPVGVWVEVSAETFSAADDAIAGEVLLLVQSVNREQLAGRNVFFDRSVLQIKYNTFR